MAENDSRKLTWQAPEFEHRPKTATWYWVSMIVAMMLLALAIWQKNYIFGVFVVIAELLLMVWGSYEPPMVAFSLNEKGLSIGGKKFYPFHDIRSWSADSEGFFDPEWPDIFIHFRGHFHPGLKIKVPRPLFTEVEDIFRERAEEVPFEPSTIDVLEKFLGF
jgi:hypothetical protein